MPNQTDTIALLRKWGRIPIVLLLCAALLFLLLPSCGTGGSGAGSESGSGSGPDSTGSPAPATERPPIFTGVLSDPVIPSGYPLPVETDPPASISPDSVGPDGSVLVRGMLSEDGTAVSAHPVVWKDRPDTPSDTWNAYDDACGPEEEFPFAPDAELLYYPHLDSPEIYALNPATIEASIQQSREGRLMELTRNEEGLVTRLVLRNSVDLDLDGANLDFTGFTGSVWAHGDDVTLQADGTMLVDPCETDSWQADEDHTQYTLSLSPKAEIPENLKTALAPDSSTEKPWYCVMNMENGAVESVQEFLYLVNYIDSYNEWHTSPLEFTASTALRDGLTQYYFHNETAGVNVYVNPQEVELTEDQKTDFEKTYGATTYSLAAVEYEGKTAEIHMPVNPIATNVSHAAGECSMCVTDITGDGTPEFIYIFGYHGSGAGEDHALAVDLAEMKTLYVQVTEDVLHSLEDKVTLTATGTHTELTASGEEGDLVLDIHVALDNGESYDTTLSYFPEDYDDPVSDFTGISHLDFCYSIYLNETNDKLMLRCYIVPEDVLMWFLGAIDIPLELSPEGDAIVISQEMHLVGLEDGW